MWRTCEYRYVSRPCEVVFPLDLSLTSFHSVAVRFAIMIYYVLSELDFGEFKRFDGSIYRNLRELSLFINTTWPPGGGVLWEFLGGDVPLGPWNP